MHLSPLPIVPVSSVEGLARGIRFCPSSRIDVSIAYELFGAAEYPSGEVVLLVAGFNFNSRMFPADFCRALASTGGFRVIRFDLRDTGLSTKMDHQGHPPLWRQIVPPRILPVKPAYTLEDMADDCAALLDHLGIAGAHLVGVSMGGMIAQLIAIRHRDKARSLVSMMGSTSAWDLPRPPLWVQLHLGVRRPRSDSFRDQHAFRCAFDERVCIADDLRATESAAKAFIARNNAAVLHHSTYRDGHARMLTAIAQARPRDDQLRAISDLPTVVLHGAKDEVVPVEHGVRTAACIAGSRLVIHPDGAHSFPGDARFWPFVVSEILWAAARARPRPAGAAPTDAEALAPVRGEVVRRPPEGLQSEHYASHAYQYAFTARPGACAPAAIVYAQCDDDIRAAIRHARERDVAIALRSGGHQYIGASSTTGANIQLDLSAYDSFEFDAGTQTLRMGVGLRLVDMTHRLGQLDAGIYFPHGQCGYVALGGHMQTGGYSMLTRCLGMFIDYIVEFDLITADGAKRTVRKPTPARPDFENDELWFAVLGGSPGNFGVITHVSVRPGRDADHPHARWLDIQLPYSKACSTTFCELVTEYADDAALPADYTITIAKVDLPDPDAGFGEATHRSIHILAAWTNNGGAAQPYDAEVASFFRRILTAAEPFRRAGRPPPEVEPLPISRMLSRTLLMMDGQRPFDKPMLHWTASAKTHDLAERGFARWIADRTHELEGLEGCDLVLQFCPFGGTHSQLRTGAATTGSALAHRDTVLSCSLSSFYSTTHPHTGEPWSEPEEQTRRLLERVNAEAVGPTGRLAGREYRWIGEPAHHDLDAARACYFDSEAVYRRVLATKRRVDPEDIFTANAFCVGFSDSRRASEAPSQPAGSTRRWTDTELLTAGARRGINAAAMAAHRSALLDALARERTTPTT